MTEILTLSIGMAMLVGTGYAGYLGGRDAAERKAGETIANLRRRCLVLNAQRDRLLESNARLSRSLGLTANPPRLPMWMDDDA